MAVNPAEVMAPPTKRQQELASGPTTSNRYSETPTIVNSVKYNRLSDTSLAADSVKHPVDDIPCLSPPSNSSSCGVTNDGPCGADKARSEPKSHEEKYIETNEPTQAQHPNCAPSQTDDWSADLVDWDGPQDLDNPQNWDSKYKWWIIMILACMTFVVSFGSSVWSTATIVTAEEFGVSQEVMILGVTFYVVGFALGPLVFGPLSELYGRRTPLMAGMIGFIVFQIPVGVAQNLPTIFVCRFLGGAFGSAALAIVPGLAVDIFDHVQRGVSTMAYAAAVFAGPAMGPIVGEFTVKNQALGWRWTAWFTMIMGAFFYIIALFTVQETFPPVLLRQKAARLRLETKNWALHTKLDEEPMMIKEPILIIMTIYISLVYGILYLIFFAYPYSFQGDRDMALGVSSLPFLAIFIGVLVACAILTWETKVVFTPKLFRAKKVIPEERLPPMMVGGIILVAGLFWFAWTSQPGVNVWPQIVSGVFIGCGIIMVFMPAVIYLIDVYLFDANSALAANTFVRSLVAAVFPLFAPFMYRDLGTQWATSLLAFLCVALLPATFFLYKYGAKIRSWSKFAYDSG